MRQVIFILFPPYEQRGRRGGTLPNLLFLFSFPCSVDDERDWPQCKVVFSGLVTNTLNVRNNNNFMHVVESPYGLGVKRKCLSLHQLQYCNVSCVLDYKPLLLYKCVSVCVCVFSSHSFWTSSSLDVPARVTQDFSSNLLSAVRALIFLARGIQPFLSLVDGKVEFYVLTI